MGRDHKSNLRVRAFSLQYPPQKILIGSKVASLVVGGVLFL